MEFVIVGNMVIELNTWEDIKYASEMARDEGLESVPVYAGTPPSYGDDMDAVKTGQRVFA